MLQVVVRSDAIKAQSAGYQARMTVASTRLAGRIMLMRQVFERGAARFVAHQRTAQRTGKPMLHDGRIDTLREDLFGPLAALGWPRGWPVPPASVLHGLRLGSAVPLEAMGKAPPGGRADPDSYLTVLYDGPLQARQFGDMAALAIYFDPLNRIEIIWIDREADVSSGVAWLAAESLDFTDWAGFSPDYAEWLAGND
ncbi:hypothetical protein ACX40Y_05565 [Sphingomonas sp. RS6]